MQENIQWDRTIDYSIPLLPQVHVLSQSRSGRRRYTK